MNRSFDQPIKRTTLFFNVVLSSMLVSSWGDAQGPSGMSGFELGPGVVIDAEHSQAYVMNPRSGIDALRLVDGTQAWTSDSADTPIQVKGNQLVSQATPRPESRELKILSLDAANGKRKGQAGVIPLEAGMAAGSDETPFSQLRVRAGRIVGEQADVSLHFMSVPSQGVDPEARARLSAPSGARPRPRGRRPNAENAAANRVADAPPPAAANATAFRIDFSQGTVRAIEGIAADAVPSVEARPGAATIKGEKYPSADGRYFMVIEPSTIDMVAIYNADNGKPIGKVPGDLASKSFYVKELDAENYLIIVDSPAHERAVEQTAAESKAAAGKEPARKKLLHEPRKIRAFDLKSGRELWNHEVREADYRGPLPG